jgi:hypothetical protein
MVETKRRVVSPRGVFALDAGGIINSSQGPVYSSHSVPGSAKDRVQDLLMVSQDN